MCLRPEEVEETQEHHTDAEFRELAVCRFILSVTIMIGILLEEVIELLLNADTQEHGPRID